MSSVTRNEASANATRVNVHRIAPAAEPIPLPPPRGPYIHKDPLVVDHPPKPCGGPVREFRTTNGLGQLEAVHSGVGLTVDDVIGDVLGWISLAQWGEESTGYDETILSNSQVVAIVHASPSGVSVTRLDARDEEGERTIPEPEPEPTPAAPRLRLHLRRAAAGLNAAVDMMRVVEARYKEIKADMTRAERDEWYVANVEPVEAILQAANDYLESEMREEDVAALWHAGRLFIYGHGDVARGLEVCPESVAIVSAELIVGQPGD